MKRLALVFALLAAGTPAGAAGVNTKPLYVINYTTLLMNVQVDEGAKGRVPPKSSITMPALLKPSD